MTAAAGCPAHPIVLQSAAGPPQAHSLTSSPGAVGRREIRAGQTVRDRADRHLAELRRHLAAIFDAPIMAHAQWSVVVRSLDSGEALYERNSRKLMMPASNMKIVTVAAASHVLGWDARFVTTLETAAHVRNGTLEGDLIVRGGGDPTLNRRNGRAAAVLDEWAAALRSAGISRIAGRVVGDDSSLAGEPLGAGWMWDDLQFAYAAPVSALQFEENAAELTVSAGAAVGEPAMVHLTPGSGLTVVNRVITTAPGGPAQIDCRRRVDRPVVEVTGTLPLPLQAIDGERVDERPVVRRIGVANPALFAAQAVKDALIARGIAVTGDAAGLEDLPWPEAGSDRTARRVLARTESPPLREIAQVVNKESQNLYAETILRAADVATGGTGAGGESAVLNIVRGWRLDDGSLLMADGSGMSRYNYVSAALLVQVLTRMYRDPAHRDAFTATLAIAGRDGTLAGRLRRTRAEGNAAAKTGSLANVRALSGYVRTRDGEPLVFSIVANSFAVPGATVTWIIDLAVEVLANFSRSGPGARVPVADR